MAKDKDTSAETTDDKAQAAAAASAAGAGAAPGRPRRRLQYIDRMEVVETFADSIQHMYFDGQTLRIEFCTTRIADQPRGPGVARRFPVSRIALTGAAAVDLINRAQRVGAALTRAGLLRKGAAPPAKKD